MGLRANKDTIKEWLLQGIQKGASHCLVICDTWDYYEGGFEDFPVYVMPYENVDVIAAKYPPDGIERLIAVYDLSIDIEELLENVSLLKQPSRGYNL